MLGRVKNPFLGASVLLVCLHENIGCDPTAIRNVKISVIALAVSR